MRYVRFLIAAALVLLTLGVALPAQAAQPEGCRIVKMLESAGFKGHSNRVAYAIVMRESRGVNLNESSRWYTGALGVWQIQTSAWSRKPWWSRSAMLNPYQQSRIVFTHMTNRGRSWAHWGIRSDGRGMDTTYYRAWSGWQQWNWIWAPYEKFYRGYPRC